MSLRFWQTLYIDPMQPYGAPRRSNTGLIVGLILGGIGLCCVLPIVLFGGAAFFGFNKVKGFATCAIAYEDLNLSIRAYAKEHNDMLPPAATWQTEIIPYYKKRLSTEPDAGPFQKMPADGEWGCKNEKGVTGIAFNSEIGGKKLKDLDPKTPVLFEIEAPKLNATEKFKARDPKTGPELMMGQRRSWIVLMADGTMDVRDPNGKPLEIDPK